MAVADRRLFWLSVLTTRMVSQERIGSVPYGKA